ncbi:hypothetical protein CHS0354_000188 [Potamilus streckersoni]|uniref:Uncharacterized protein n=1 Tax=Potamilus streckersoni TaxID=2493646 RepID=A0AAE0VEC6_9BIVA|nr:hypothetical protein CHS0354_000188 [Potamilus streckersoni]
MGETVEAALEIIDLSDPETLDVHIPNSDKRARNYAKKYKEVLVIGSISEWRIELVEEKLNLSKKIDVSDYSNSDEEVSNDDVSNLATNLGRISFFDTDSSSD